MERKKKDSYFNISLMIPRKQPHFKRDFHLLLSKVKARMVLVKGCSQNLGMVFTEALLSYLDNTDLPRRCEDSVGVSTSHPSDERGGVKSELQIQVEGQMKAAPDQGMKEDPEAQAVGSHDSMDCRESPSITGAAASGNFNSFVASAKVLPTRKVSPTGGVSPYGARPFEFIDEKLEKAYQKHPDVFVGESLWKTKCRKREFLCQYCGDVRTLIWSKFKNHLDQHLPTWEYSHKCKFCSAKYSTASNLQSHVRRNHDKKLMACDRCGKIFNGQKNLDRHMFVHSGLRPHVCDICHASFNQMTNLKTHRKSHKNNAVAIKEWFQCPHCEVTCGNKRGLKTHMESHS